MIPPMPVITSAIVPGSGTFAVAVNFSFPGQQPFLHWKPIWKVIPFVMPENSPPAFSKMMVLPLELNTLQLKRSERQVIAPAGTPDSTNFREVQSTPEWLVKVRNPVPLGGVKN